jgi:hypothetical protein
MASGVGIEISGTTYPECMGWKLFCPRRFVIVLCPNNNTQIHLHTFGFLNAPREKDCHNPMQTRPVCPACLPVPAFLGNRQVVGYLAGLRNCIYMVLCPCPPECGAWNVYANRMSSSPTSIPRVLAGIFPFHATWPRMQPCAAAAVRISPPSPHFPGSWIVDRRCTAPLSGAGRGDAGSHSSKPRLSSNAKFQRCVPLAVAAKPLAVR